MNKYLFCMFCIILTCMSCTKLTDESNEPMADLIIENIEFLNPANLTVRAFEEICHPVEAQIEILTDKNATLRHTRDLLLPKLISGKLDVSDLDIKTGGHVQ